MSLKIILEASVGKGQSARVVEIIKDRIERKTGMSLYPNEAMDTVIRDDGKNYGIFIMFSDGNHAIRLNWKSAGGTSEVIDSIDFWLKPSANPQYSANTNDMNIVQVINLIDDVIHGISTGSEDEELIEESYKKKYFEERSKTFKDVRELLSEKGYHIEKDPAFTVRRYLVTDPKQNVIPIRYTPKMDEMYKEIQSTGIEGFLQKHNAGGTRSDTSSIVKPGGKNEPAPMPEPKGEFDDLFEQPFNEEELFGLLEEGINDVKVGKAKTMIITGDPGVGKSYTVIQRMIGQNAEFFKGGITSASALYKLLFINNEPGKILIFDDLDDLLEDKESANIFKGALDGNPGSEVAYISNNTVHPTYYKVLTGELDAEDPNVIKELNMLKIDIEGMSEKRFEVMQSRAKDPYHASAILPNKFAFDGKVIFISNLYLDEIPGPLRSRASIKVEVNLTLEEIVNRIERLVDDIEVPVEEGTPPVKPKDRRQALKYLKTILVPYGKIPKIDFRDFQAICIRASGNAPWELWTRWASRQLRENYFQREAKRKKR